VSAETATSPRELEGLRRVFEAQRGRYLAEPNPPARERRAKLDALERAIRAHRREIASAIGADFRKPAAEVEATEIVPTLAALKHARAHLAGWMRPRPVATPLTLFGARSEVRYEPKGVALILSPWNYPFLLALTPLIGALAAGNRAILRPSEKSPHTTETIGTIVAEAFEPEDVAFVGGGVEVAEALLAWPFDHFFFTGSTRVGKIVMHAAAEQLAGVTLELGGKSPAFVTDDADIRTAAARIAWGKFMNAGQTCVAPDYVLVDERRARGFVECLVVAVEKMYGRGEDARARNPDFPRLINDEAFDRLSATLDATVASGATIEMGGGRNRADRYIAPTLLTGLSFGAPIMADEIFGPILPVITYRALDEAIAQVNARPKPLALYVFGRHERAERILRGVPAGGSAVNDVVVHLANPNLPFGGIGPSGVGNYQGWFGFRALSHERAVLRQARFSFASFLYPPFGKKTAFALKAMERF
jgi:aldehyde dehydrogenase (NAD+)